jgi:hypothetical protein
LLEKVAVRQKVTLTTTVRGTTVPGTAEEHAPLA